MDFAFHIFAFPFFSFLSTLFLSLEDMSQESASSSIGMHHYQWRRHLAVTTLKKEDSTGQTCLLYAQCSRAHARMRTSLVRRFCFLIHSSFNYFLQRAARSSFLLYIGSEMPVRSWRSHLISSLEQPVVPVASQPARRSALEAVLDIVLLAAFLFFRLLVSHLLFSSFLHIVFARWF